MPDYTGIIDDPRFQKYSLEERLAALRQMGADEHFLSNYAQKEEAPRLEPARQDLSTWDRIKNTMADAASRYRIRGGKIAEAREAGLRGYPTEEELAISAAMIGGAGPMVGAFAAAPLATTASLGAGLGVGKVAGMAGEKIGEEIAPGFGETLLGPTAELGGFVAGGGAGMRLANALKRGVARGPATGQLDIPFEGPPPRVTPPAAAEVSAAIEATPPQARKSLIQKILNAIEGRNPGMVDALLEDAPKFISEGVGLAGGVAGAKLGPRGGFFVGRRMAKLAAKRVTDPIANLLKRVAGKATTAESAEEDLISKIMKEGFTREQAVKFTQHEVSVGAAAAPKPKPPTPSGAPKPKDPELMAAIDKAVARSKAAMGTPSTPKVPTKPSETKIPGPGAKPKKPKPKVTVVKPISQARREKALDDLRHNREPDDVEAAIAVADEVGFAFAPTIKGTPIPKPKPRAGLVKKTPTPKPAKAPKPAKPPEEPPAAEDFIQSVVGPTGRKRLPVRPGKPLKRHPIVSSAFKTWGYSPKKKILDLEMMDGRVHRYHGVEPSEIAAVEAAESKGKALGEIIRRHPVTRQGTEIEAAVKAATTKPPKKVPSPEGAGAKAPKKPGLLARIFGGGKEPAQPSRRAFLGKAAKGGVGAAMAPKAAAKVTGTVAERALKGTLTQAETKTLGRVAENAAQQEDISLFMDAVDGYDALSATNRIKVMAKLWAGGEYEALAAPGAPSFMAEFPEYLIADMVAAESTKPAAARALFEAAKSLITPEQLKSAGSLTARKLMSIAESGEIMGGVLPKYAKEAARAAAKALPKPAAPPPAPAPPAPATVAGAPAAVKPGAPAVPAKPPPGIIETTAKVVKPPPKPPAKLKPGYYGEDVDGLTVLQDGTKVWWSERSMVIEAAGKDPIWVDASVGRINPDSLPKARRKEILDIVRRQEKIEREIGAVPLEEGGGWPPKLQKDFESAYRRADQAEAIAAAAKPKPKKPGLVSKIVRAAPEKVSRIKKAARLALSKLKPSGEPVDQSRRGFLRGATSIAADVATGGKGVKTLAETTGKAVTEVAGSRTGNIHADAAIKTIEAWKKLGRKDKWGAGDAWMDLPWSDGPEKVAAAKALLQHYPDAAKYMGGGGALKQVAAGRFDLFWKGVETEAAATRSEVSTQAVKALESKLGPAKAPPKPKTEVEAAVEAATKAAEGKALPKAIVAAQKALPPVPKDHTRLWRVEGKSAVQAGAAGGKRGSDWFEENLGAYATGKTKPGDVKYVDIPNDRLAQLKATPNATEVQLPEGYVAQAKSLRPGGLVPKTPPASPSRRAFLSKTAKGVAGAALPKPVVAKAIEAAIKPKKAIDLGAAFKKLFSSKTEQFYNQDRGTSADYSEATSWLRMVIRAVSRGEKTVADFWGGDQVPISKAVKGLKIYATGKGGEVPFPPISELKPVVKMLGRDPSKVVAAWDKYNAALSAGRRAKGEGILIDDFKFEDLLEDLVKGTKSMSKIRANLTGEGYSVKEVEAAIVNLDQATSVSPFTIERAVKDVKSGKLSAEGLEKELTRFQEPLRPGELEKGVAKARSLVDEVKAAVKTATKAKPKPGLVSKVPKPGKPVTATGYRASIKAPTKESGGWYADVAEDAELYVAASGEGGKAAVVRTVAIKLDKPLVLDLEGGNMGPGMKFVKAHSKKQTFDEDINLAVDEAVDFAKASGAYDGVVIYNHPGAELLGTSGNEYVVFGKGIPSATK